MASACEEHRGTIDVAIVAVEQDEVEALIPHCGTLESIDGERPYHLCSADSATGDRYRLAIATAGTRGSEEVARLVADVVADLAPRWIFVVGVAAALPDSELSIGDIGVCSTLVGIDGEGGLRVGCSKPARNLASKLPVLKQRMGDWTAGIRGEWAESVEARARIVSLGVSRGRLDDGLAAEATGIDMVEQQTAGLYEAADGHCPVLSIRAVARVVGEDSHPEARTRACASAAAFVAAFLEAGPLPRRARTGGPDERSWLWRLLDAQDPLMASLTFFAVSLIFIFVSFFIGLNETRLEVYEGRRVGYLHAVNWSLLYTFLAPTFIYLALSARDDVRTILRGLPGSEGLSRDWDRRRRRTMRVWWMFALVGLAISLAVWWLTSADPLFSKANLDAVDERDWTVAMLRDGSDADRLVNVVFSLCAFLMQFALIAIATAMLTAQAAFVWLVGHDLPDVAFEERGIARRFGPLLRRVLLAQLVLSAMLYLARVWRLFLQSDEGEERILEFLFPPNAWLPETGGELGFGVIAAAFLTGLLPVYLPFAIQRRALRGHREGGLEECWPMRWPGPLLLVGLFLATLATILFYWLGALLLIALLGYLLYRGVDHLARAARPEGEEGETFGAYVKSRFLGSGNWWFVSLAAAVAAMLLATVFAHAGTFTRAIMGVGVLTFIVVLALNPKRRFFRVGATVVGALLAAHALPAYRIAFDFTVGPGDVDRGALDGWGEFVNHIPDPAFTVGGLALAGALMLLDYLVSREDRPTAAPAEPAAPAGTPEPASPLPETSSLADDLQRRYRGIRGAHDWLTAFVSLGVPAVATEATDIAVGFSYPTAIYLVYHLAGFYLWTQVQDPERLRHEAVARRASAVHRYLVRWLRPVTYVLVGLTGAAWLYARFTGGDVPEALQWINALLGVEGSG